MFLFVLFGSHAFFFVMVADTVVNKQHICNSKFIDHLLTPIFFSFFFVLASQDESLVLLNKLHKLYKHKYKVNSSR